MGQVSLHCILSLLSFHFISNQLPNDAEAPGPGTIVLRTTDIWGASSPVLWGGFDFERIESALDMRSNGNCEEKEKSIKTKAIFKTHCP